VELLDLLILDYEADVEDLLLRVRSRSSGALDGGRPARMSMFSRENVAGPPGRPKVCVSRSETESNEETTCKLWLAPTFYCSIEM
jgi:hypothetical protein